MLANSKCWMPAAVVTGTNHHDWSWGGGFGYRFSISMNGCETTIVTANGLGFSLL
jgi:hypothetical protein